MKPTSDSAGKHYDDSSFPADASVEAQASGALPLPPPVPSPAPGLSAKDYLHVQPDILSRPSSPGTISNISVEEWQHLTRSAKQGSLRDPKTWRRRWDAFWLRNLGLFYMLLAAVFGTAMVVTTRFLEIQGNKGKGMHPFHVLFARMGITALLSTSYMAYRKTEHFPFGMKEVRLLLVCRGVGGFFGIFGMYYSLLYLPVSDATVLTYLAPGLSCWACSFLINEPFTRIDKIGTFVSLAGVIFIARPASLLSLGHHEVATSQHSFNATTNATNETVADPFDSANVTPQQRIIAVAFAMVGVMGAVVAYTTIRWIGKRAHPLISVNYFATWCTIVSVVMQLSIPSVGFVLPADLKDWGLLIFLGTTGFIMQFLLAAGLSYEKSSRATNMTYTSMLFALASDKIFFGVTPSASSIIGSTLILGAAIVMALQKAEPAVDKTQQPSEPTDEERGLMQDVDGDVDGEERMPIQEVQMRTLR